MPGDNWTAINSAGNEGLRGLEKGQTLATILKPLRQELGRDS